MTRVEFVPHLDRLCKGFKYVPEAIQADALFERLKHVDARDWREAVTDLLCSPRFPGSLNIFLDAIAKQAEQRRRAEAVKANQQSMAVCGGKVQPAGVNEHERRYNQYRMELLAGVLIRSTTGAPMFDQRPIAQRHAEDLADWLANPERAAWAKTVSITGCGFHSGEHTLFSCLVDEVSYWQARASGVPERDARKSLQEVS